MTFTEIFEKQSGEKLPKAIDYTGRLPEGTTVSSATMSAILYPDGTDMTATVLDGVATVTTTRITQMVKAGVSGKDYRITYQANLSGGGILEDDLLMQVRDL